MEPVSWLQNESPRQNINLALIVVSQSWVDEGESDNVDYDVSSFVITIPS